MEESITRVVTYEEIAHIINVGAKKNPDYNPTTEDHVSYVDIIGKVLSSVHAMTDHCKNYDIPFTVIEKDPMRIRVIISRDTKAEDEASSYMTKKYPVWDGVWNSEFAGFVQGWKKAMLHSE